MIHKLSGTVDSLAEDLAVIDVGGVGYGVTCSARTLARLEAGAAAALQIETHMREDRIQLYGFRDAAERDWFRLLLTVQGVGAKVALAVLSVAEPDDLARAVAAQDKALVQRAAGVGARLAQRIVAELKDKAPMPAFSPAPAGGDAAPAPVTGGAAAEAQSALVNLGYGRAEAMQAVAEAATAAGDDADTGALVKAALARLARRLEQA